MSQQLKDSQGRLIGSLHQGFGNCLEIRNRYGALVGRYRDGRTYNGLGKLVGTGNLLAMCLKPYDQQTISDYWDP